MEAVWEHTQSPDLHERWDLRFTRIEYLPKEDESDPQRFRYSTKIGFGLEVAGEGESRGQRNLPDGTCSSALRFWSNDPRALILEGSGYWKYIPTNEGVKFLTGYDYRTRYGRLGKIIDRIVFRPLMGWATAWSFDRLRLWLEKQIDPGLSLRMSLVHCVARASLGTVFAYHGLVPKLLARNANEIGMLERAGFSAGFSFAATMAFGVMELVFSVWLLFAWRSRLPLILCIAFMCAATIGLAATFPRVFLEPFNPFTLNLLVACMAVVDLVALPFLPSAGRCARKPIEEH